MTFGKNEAHKIFIGRRDELNYFAQYILYPSLPAHNIISIWGTGGVGKTTLLSRFTNVASLPEFSDFCLIAKVDERQLTPASIMEKFSEQLHLKGEFRKSLNHYKEALHRQQDGRKKFQDDILHKAPDFAGAAAESVPIVGSILREGIKATSDHLIDQYHDFQASKDAEQLENSLANLTRAFVTEINRLADGRGTLSNNWKKQEKRIILFFDTFEQLATEITPWLLDYFLEAKISNNVVLVIAGRYSIEIRLPMGGNVGYVIMMMKLFIQFI